MSDVAIHFTDETQVTEETTTTEDALFPTTETTLTVVPSTPAGPATPVSPATGTFGDFEKAKVSTSEVKISGACAIDTHGELSVSLDDIIRAVGEFRVVKVNHYVNKAGDVVRQQVLAPVEHLVIVPWDAGNVKDDGIVRARP